MKMKMKNIYKISGTITSDEVDEEGLEDYTCYHCDTNLLNAIAQTLYADSYGNYYCEEKECVYHMLSECYTVEIDGIEEVIDEEE